MLVNEPGSAGFGQISWNADIEDVRKSQTCWDHVCWGGIFVHKQKKWMCKRRCKRIVGITIFYHHIFFKTSVFFLVEAHEAMAKLLDLFQDHGNSVSFGGCSYLQCSTHRYLPGTSGWFRDGRQMTWVLKYPVSPKRKLNLKN